MFKPSLRGYSQKTSTLADLVQNYIPVASRSQRLKLLTEYAFGALRDPLRADYVAAVGDLTSVHALRDIRRRMLVDEEGQQILRDRPRVNDSTWNKERLGCLPKNTFGYHYFTWMSKFNYSSEDRTPTKYVPDLELAYIMQRYRETHDTLHVLLNYDVTVSEELAVKWFEMIQLGLPSTALAAFFGPFNLLANRDLGQLQRLTTTYLPHIL
jgi:ubiquinone biosynthesis protein COQ4